MPEPDLKTAVGDSPPIEGRWEMEGTPCDFCGSGEADVLLTGRDRLHGLPGSFQIVSCRRCGLVRTCPRPTLDSMGTAYPSTYGPHKAESIATQPPGGLLRWALVNFRNYPLGKPAAGALKWLLTPLAAKTLRSRHGLDYLPYVAPGKLLDFGCGGGAYLAKMSLAGWKVEGMDLSEEAQRSASQAGITVHLGTLPGLELPEESYDALTMWHALEHVPSPMATLRSAWKLLRPGGRLLVALPRFDSLQRDWFGSAWFPLDLPRHLTHFTKATLHRHLETAGFQVGRNWPVRRGTVIRRSFGYLAKETGKPLYGSLAKSRLVVGLMNWLCLLNDGRTAEMICVARKP